MADLHIDDFYHDAGLILAQLYQGFPGKTAVYIEDIIGPDQTDEYGLHSVRHLACLSAMIWLAEEGYLKYESTIRQEAIDQAVLSHKGFTLLVSRCELDRGGLDDDTGSNIDHLRHTLKSRSSTAVKEIMQYLLDREYGRDSR